MRAIDRQSTCGCCCVTELGSDLTASPKISRLPAKARCRVGSERNASCVNGSAADRRYVVSSRMWISSSRAEGDIQGLPQNSLSQMSAQAFYSHQINAPGKNRFQVIHQLKKGIKIFATRLKRHQQIDVAIWVNALITRKRAEDGAPSKPHRPQDAGVSAEAIQNIRAIDSRRNPC